MKKLNHLKILFFLFSSVLQAQEKDKTLFKANEGYKQNKFDEAEANYRISNSKFPDKAIASYNLGNAIYKQKYSAEAKYAYLLSLEKAKTKTEKHQIFHNLGNTFMTDKDYGAAVEAYKNALRNNPTDEETRYNYALAKKMLKENPPKNDKNDKNKDKKDDKKNEDKNKDNQNKDNQDNKNNEDKNKDNKNNKNDKSNNKQENNGEPKPIPGGLSKQRLENLLDAVNNEEKNVQDKMKGQREKGKPIKNEKDW